MKIFEPSAFWRSPHVQTIGAALPVWAPPRSFLVEARERLRVPVDDGAAIVAHAWWVSPSDAARPAALLVHGVGGTSESRYMVRAAVALHRKGFHVVRMNMRGAGEGLADAPSLYHAGLTSDVRDVAAFLAADRRVSEVAVVGFSLGGNVAIKLAGELGDAVGSPIRAVVALSAPLDLVVTSRLIERWRNLPYKAYILRNLVGQARAFARTHPHRARYDAARLLRTTSIRGYDDHVIAPMHGFSGVDEYYRKTSAGPYVGAIRLPTLLLHAEDDPIVPGFAVRPFLESVPPSVQVEVTDLGGHVAWVGGFSEEAFVETWGVRRAAEFLWRHARPAPSPS